MNTSRACFRFRPAYQAASLSGVLQTPSLATSSSFSRLKPQSSIVSFLFNVLFLARQTTRDREGQREDFEKAYGNPDGPPQSLQARRRHIKDLAYLCGKQQTAQVSDCPNSGLEASRTPEAKAVANKTAENQRAKRTTSSEDHQLVSNCVLRLFLVGSLS